MHYYLFCSSTSGIFFTITIEQNFLQKMKPAYPTTKIYFYDNHITPKSKLLRKIFRARILSTLNSTYHAWENSLLKKIQKIQQKKESIVAYHFSFLPKLIGQKKIFISFLSFCFLAVFLSTTTTIFTFRKKMNWLHTQKAHSLKTLRLQNHGVQLSLKNIRKVGRRWSPHHHHQQQWSLK